VVFGRWPSFFAAMGRESGETRRVIEVREDDEKQSAPADREARRSGEPRADERPEEPPAATAGSATGTGGAQTKGGQKDARLKPPPSKGAGGGASSAAAAPAKQAAKGLGEDILTQVAQAKFEAQEDKLRDVARHSMSLLRDYSKINASECARRVADIRRSLAKYDMQYIRVWDLQERVRVAEVAELATTTANCIKEAEAEAKEIVGLRAALAREEQRRKRYEGYEEVAAEVNCKKSRKDSQAAIATVKADIAKIKQQQADLEEMTEVRTQRAQILVRAVADLRADLDQEGPAAAERTAAAKTAAAGASTPPSGPVEVIS